MRLSYHHASFLVYEYSALVKTQWTASQTQS